MQAVKHETWNAAKTMIIATGALKAEMFIHVLNQSEFQSQVRCNGLPTHDLRVGYRLQPMAAKLICLISWLQ